MFNYNIAYVYMSSFILVNYVSISLFFFFSFLYFPLS